MGMGIETKIALESFSISFLLFLLVGVVNAYFIPYFTSVLIATSIIFSSSGIILAIFIKLLFQSSSFPVAIRASFLGIIFALGIYIKATTPPHIQIFGVYLCVMAFFHISEFVVISVIQSTPVSTDSFLLNHSPQYTVAAIASWLEFLIEGYLFPGMKQIYWLSNLGLGVCIFGDLLRKFSMLTAGSSFNHLVQCEKSKDHVLITHGVYSLFRHPSYVGWFYWAVGTQIILLNPLCVPAYAVASWLFFKMRIYVEEITLLNFFGQNYCNYKQKVGTGLPFIDGYKI